MVYGFHTLIRMRKTKSVAMASTGQSMGQSKEYTKKAYTELSNPMPHRKEIYSNKEVKNCKDQINN
jgi:hypothetical protein